MSKDVGKDGSAASQQRVVEILEELLKWTRFSSLPGVRKTLLDILPTDEHKIAYQYSDGKGSEEVAKFTGVGSASIQRWWKVWIKARIADPMSVQRGERAKRIFSLEEVGIEVPIPKPKAPISGIPVTILQSEEKPEEEKQDE